MRDDDLPIGKNMRPVDHVDVPVDGPAKSLTGWRGAILQVVVILVLIAAWTLQSAFDLSWWITGVLAFVLMAGVGSLARAILRAI